MRKILTFLIALAAVAFAICSPATAQCSRMGGGVLVCNPAPGAPGYTAQGVYFDATTSTKRGGQFTGIADSKVGTISFWFKAVGGDGTNMELFAQDFGTHGGVSFFRLSSGLFRIQLQNSAGTNIFLGTNNTNTFNVADGWKHFLASWDLSTTTMQIYVEDVSDLGTPSANTNDTINYSSVDGQWWMFVNSGSPGNADITDLYFDPTTHLDLSVTANRRKFISAGLAPVDLGATCQLPTGSQPIACFKGPFGSFNTNVGTGGNFTTNAGALQAAGSNPP